MQFLLANPFRLVYAAIDLKNATIIIKDGYAGPADPAGAVNNVAGYSTGATSITVDGFTGSLTVGDYVTIAGSAEATEARLTRHLVTAATGSPTTSITISPGLSAAVADNAVVTVVPHEIEVTVGEGNMQYTEKRNIEYVRDRGRLDTVREGDEEPVEVRLDFTWEFIKADTGEVPTIEDAIKQRGEASGWTSSSADSCEPYAVDIEIYYNPPCSNAKDEVILLQDFRWEQLDHNARDGQISMTGKCNVKEATVTRVTTA